jgi:hypothetical protein
MFCPEGYVTLHACQAVFRDIARERWKNDRPEFLKLMKKTRYEVQQENEAYDEGATYDYVPDWKRPAITKENWEIASYFPAFRRWATTFLIVKHIDKIWACSPQGQTVQPSDDLFETDGAFRFSFLLYSEGFAELEEKQARFTFLEEPYFTIKSAEFFPSNVPEPKRRRFQPFAGWSICWKPKNFENWQQELHEIIADLPEERADDVEAETAEFAVEGNIEPIVGEPKRPDNGQQEAGDVFADPVDERAEDVQAVGRRRTLREEKNVADQIVALYDADNQVTKEICKQKTTPMLGSKAFARSWARATEQRPDLSRPGRRPNKSPPLKPVN